MEFGLTGGIGSGKSSVSDLLRGHGAKIIDADAIVRSLQRPGELVFDAMVERWGSTIVQSEGAEAGMLDRAAVAGIVFSDDTELQALNAIVHPAVADETQRLLDELAGSDEIVVHDIPLLVVPGGELLTSRDHTEWAGIIVVDTPVDLAIDRVVEARGMDRDAVVARMEAQATREERRAVADFVIDNSGTLEDLGERVAECWQWMQEQSGLDGSSGADENAGLDGSSGTEGTKSAHIENAGLDGSSGTEGSRSAHVENAGLDGSSGVENSGENT